MHSFMHSMNKFARTRSSDPEQEKLRAAKDEWNEEVSLLISELIAFKRAVNGRGDKNFGIPPSSIKDPLPPQVSSLMGLISTQSNKVVNDASKIEQLQSYYSAHRRKGKIASAESLTAEASWWGSRLWAYFALLKKVDRAERRLRLQMISSCQELMSDIKDFEKLVTAYKAPNSIPASVSRLSETLYSLLGDLAVSFDKLIELQSAKKDIAKDVKPNNAPEEQSQKDETVPPPMVEPTENQEGAEYAQFQALKAQQTAIQMVVLHLLSLDEVSDSDKKRLEDNENKFQTKITTYNNLMNRKDVENVVNTDKLMDAIQKHYRILQDIVSKYLGNSDFTSLISTLENKISLVQQASEHLEWLEKQAVSSIDHWLNQKLLAINPSNMDKIRIDVADIAGRLRKEIDGFSDLLEQGEPIEALVKQFQMIKKSIVSLITRLQALSNVYETRIRPLNNDEDSDFQPIDGKIMRRLEKIKLELEQS